MPSPTVSWPRSRGPQGDLDRCDGFRATRFGSVRNRAAVPFSGFQLAGAATSAHTRPVSDTSDRPHRLIVVNDEPRAAVVARLETSLGPLTVANTHLSCEPGWNRRQLRSIGAELQGLPGPRLVVGDLSLTSAAAQRWSGLRTPAPAPTYPAHRPRRQLDHILTDDPGLTVRHRETPLMPISDHRPLVVDLERH
jgi:endonuclease/exonuclease/phosphatase family metal-dependent hydrolase